MELGFVGGFVDAAGIQVQPVAMDHVVLIAPASHRLAGRNDVLAPELAGETFIVREPGSSTCQVTDTALTTLGISPHRTLEMTSCEAVKRAVAAGLGLAFISHYAIELELRQGILSVLQGTSLTFSHQLYLVSRKERRLSPAALAFRAFALKQLISLNHQPQPYDVLLSMN